MVDDKKSGKKKKTLPTSDKEKSSTKISKNAVVKPSPIKLSTKPQLNIKSKLKNDNSPKAVRAEIVEGEKLTLKDVSDKFVTSSPETEDLSPLDVAAAKAEQAYQNANDDDFEYEEDETSKTPQVASNKSLAVPTSHLPKTTDPLVLYLNEIRKYPLLTREKEKEITMKYFESKDPESAQLLVRSNLRFVVKIAAEYSKFGAKLIDLIQEGNVGLMHAVREFNPYKGARLITYAVWWIRGYIQEYLMRQYSMVRIGTTQNQRKLFYQLQKEKNNLEALSNEKNLTELSERLGIPEDEIKIMAQRLHGRDVSLDKTVGDDGSTLGAFQSSSEENLEEAFARQEMIKLLQSKLSELEPELSEREKIILHERILNEEPLTLQEIGEKYGITREAVRQMEVRVIKKIKDKFGEF